MVKEKALNSHVTLKLKCSGPTGRAVGHVEFQRQRADIADGQTLTAGQYYYIIITPRAALAETMHGVQCYPAERPVPPWSRQDHPPPAGGGTSMEAHAH